MHPTLSLQIAVGVLARDQHRNALDTRFIPGLNVYQIDLEPARFAVALIHAQEHVRPITTLRAASARVNAEDGVGLVMLRAQQVFELKLIELLLGGVDLRGDSRLRLAQV